MAATSAKPSYSELQDYLKSAAALLRAIADGRVAPTDPSISDSILAIEDAAGPPD